MTRIKTEFIWNPKLSSQYSNTLKLLCYSDWWLINSGIVNYEINQTSDDERRERLLSLVNSATDFVSVDQIIYT